MKFTLYLSQLLVPTHSFGVVNIHGIFVVPQSQWHYHILSPSLYSPRARCAISNLNTCGCRDRYGVLLIMGSVPSRSAALPHCHRVGLKMPVEAIPECVWKCALAHRSRELRVELGCCHLVHLEMHLETLMKRVLKCAFEAMIMWTWRSWLSKYGDTHAGNDRVNMEAVIEWVSRYSLEGMVMPTWLS